MSQFGWAQASSGVTSNMLSKVRALNGPPEAVSTILFTRWA